MVSTMRESIVSDLHITDAQFGLLTSVFLWSYGILSPFGGFLADRYRREYVIIGSLLIWSVVTWLTGYSQTFGQLIMTRVLMGVSEAFYMPAALALIVDYHPGRTQSTAVGIHLTGTTVGQSLGFLGGMLAERMSWGYAFRYFGVIGILYSFVVVFLLKRPDEIAGNREEKRVERIHFFDAMKALFAKRAFGYLLLFWCMLGVVGWLVVGWLPTYYMDRFHLSQGIAGLYATAYLYPASILGLILGGVFSDRWLKRNKYARIAVPMIGLAIAAPSIFVASYIAAVLPAIIFFLCYAFSRMFVDSNLMSVLCMIVDERYRATGYGILNMLATIVGGIGIFAAGVLRDRAVNLGTVYQSAAGCLLICIVLMYGVYKKVKASNEKQ